MLILPMPSLLSGKHIVLVEDEGIIQMQVARMLTRAGLVVVGQAKSAEEGFALILREKPELVLTDITLPGINGLELTRLITGAYATCVIIMSAHGTEEYQRQALDAGACGYIVKPITADILIATLERFYQQYTTN